MFLFILLIILKFLPYSILTYLLPRKHNSSELPERHSSLKMFRHTSFSKYVLPPVEYIPPPRPVCLVMLLFAGCPTDYSILGVVQTVTSARTLQTNFDAFKFPTSDLVQFRALVTPCIPSCKPVICTPPGYPPKNINSYGRRRRRRRGVEEEAPLLVANAMRIVDTFEFLGSEGGGDGGARGEEGGVPGTLVWIALLACQVPIYK